MDDKSLENFFPLEKIVKSALHIDGIIAMDLSFFSIFLKVFLIKDVAKYRRIRAKMPSWLIEYLPPDPEKFYSGVYKKKGKNGSNNSGQGIFSVWAPYDSSAELSLIIKELKLDRRRYDRLAEKYPMIPKDPSVFSDWPGKLGYDPEEAWKCFLGLETAPVVMNDSDLERDLSIKEILFELAKNYEAYYDLL